jgi:hypothetical protein
LRERKKDEPSIHAVGLSSFGATAKEIEIFNNDAQMRILKIKSSKAPQSNSNIDFGLIFGLLLLPK